MMECDKVFKVIENENISGREYSREHKRERAHVKKDVPFIELLRNKKSIIQYRIIL